LPLQHPEGQEAGSQTHWPVAVLHTWPDAHTLQLVPCVPQDALDSEANASHVPADPPTQQPFGHVVASHEHVPELTSQRPFGQEAHAAPPLPHIDAVSDGYGTQVGPLQQPLAQEVASQLQRPVPRLHS
jgi:hypothetical protein